MLFSIYKVIELYFEKDKCCKVECFMQLKYFDTKEEIIAINRKDVYKRQVYWWGMSAQLKLIIDKCYCRGLQLKNKKVGTITC